MLEQRWKLPRGDSQSLTHVKLELLEIAGEVWVAMSEQVSESIGGLFGQHEPEPFRIFDNRDWREIGSWKRFISLIEGEILYTDYFKNSGPHFWRDLTYLKI